ncbi:hypothetical protein HMPREF3222_00822 [Clostridium perfringens]|uniref:Uncharacterized protein n=1 Tax=Clostridium perfringens TaxID=1502 RepID=A0A133NBD2_CLOPF|nr:hypothetical protein HMPREF3222_00822 [Clostridium perfringens]
MINYVIKKSLLFYLNTYHVKVQSNSPSYAEGVRVSFKYISC